MYSSKYSLAVAILLAFGTITASARNCPKACTLELNEVCATNGKEYRLFSNPCMLDVFNCEHEFKWMQTMSLKPCLVDTKPISVASEPCGKPCTREYNPVCGFNGFEYKTFPNHCVMENEHCKDHMEWKQTRMGECATPTSTEIEIKHNCVRPCNKMYKPVCGYNGEQHKIFANECLMENENCKTTQKYIASPFFECVPKPRSLESVSKKGCFKACNKMYKPVCGTDGQTYKIFSNECVMENENCADNHHWKVASFTLCEKPIERKADCFKACPRIYAPVCGTDGQTYKVFDNKCLMEEEEQCGGHHWHVTNFGLCENPIPLAPAPVEKKTECMVICPRILAPVCAFDGKTYKTFDNKCIMEKTGECEHHSWQLVAFSSCSEIAEIKENKMDCIKPCNKMLAPVCGTDGFEYKTFPNKCVMENQHCLDNHKWDIAPFSMCNAPQEQKKDCPMICPLNYAPICGFNGLSQHTFANECELKAYNCMNNEHFIAKFHGECQETIEAFEAEEPKQDCPMICPLNYAPVCAFDGKTHHTFSNECELVSYNCLNHAHFIANFNGECESKYDDEAEGTFACPDNYDPQCGFDGYSYRIFDNQCMMDGYNKVHRSVHFNHVEMNFCENLLIQPKAEPKKECLKACPLIYAPICGFNGLTQHTFANDCELEVYNCMNNEHFIANFHGECQENIATFEAEEPKNDCPMICPANYAPICAFDGKTHHTFSNECELVSYNCLNHGHFIANFNGECESKYDDEAEGVFACPYNLDPQCGFDGYSYRVFANQCMMDGYNKVHKSVHFNHVDLSFCKNLL